MRSEEGKKYGGFSNIGWETRNLGKYEQPFDDNAFLFSLDSKKLFKAQKGKNQICWISDEYGLCFSGALIFHNQFMTMKKRNLHDNIGKYFIGCNKNDFNSGLNDCKLSELEVFVIH